MSTPDAEPQELSAFMFHFLWHMLMNEKMEVALQKVTSLACDFILCGNLSSGVTTPPRNTSRLRSPFCSLFFWGVASPHLSPQASTTWSLVYLSDKQQLTRRSLWADAESSIDERIKTFIELKQHTWVDMSGGWMFFVFWLEIQHFLTFYKQIIDRLIELLIHRFLLQLYSEWCT